MSLLQGENRRCRGCGNMFFRQDYQLTETCSHACETRLADLGAKLALSQNPKSRINDCIQCYRSFFSREDIRYFCSKECAEAFGKPSGDAGTTEAWINPHIAQRSGKGLLATGLGVATCRVCNRVEAACKCADRGGSK